MTSELPDELLFVDTDSNAYLTSLRNWEVISTAVNRWTLENVDSRIEFTTLGGTKVNVRASNVRELVVSDQASRRADAKLSREWNEELGRGEEPDAGDSWKFSR